MERKNKKYEGDIVGIEDGLVHFMLVRANANVAYLSGRFYWFLRFQSTNAGALLFVQGQILFWLDVPIKELTDINNLSKRKKQCWSFLYKCCSLG